MSRTFFQLLASLAVFGGAGCASSYVVKVDSVISTPADPADAANNGRPGTTASAQSAGLKRQTANKQESYTIKSRNANNSEEGLRANEVVGYVKTALASKGLFEAPKPETADIVVEVSYGLDQPHTKMEERLVPVYSKAGGGVRYEEQIVVLPNGTMTTRTVPKYDPPGTRLDGEALVVVPVTTYEKYLKITARENSSDGSNAAQLWSVTVTNEDESNDLRKYVPILVSAAIDHMGEANGKSTVNLKDDSQPVAFIKGGM